MSKQLSKAQRTVLERLAEGDRIQQRIDDCFIYAGTTEVIRANTVYSLEERRFIKSGYLTIAGEEALQQSPRRAGIGRVDGGGRAIMKLVKASGKMSGKNYYSITQDGRKVGELYRFWHREDSFTNGRYYWQVAIQGDRPNSKDFETFKEAKAFVEGLA